MGASHRVQASRSYVWTFHNSPNLEFVRDLKDLIDAGARIMGACHWHVR